MAEEIARLHYGDREFIAHTESTSLWQFAGRLSLYNHVHVVLTEPNEEGYSQTTRVWEDMDTEEYEQLTEAIEGMDIERHTGMRSVSDADRDAYIAYMSKKIDKATPEDFGNAR